MGLVYILRIFFHFPRPWWEFCKILALYCRCSLWHLVRMHMFRWKGHLCTLSYFSRKSSGIHNINSVCWGCVAHHQFLVPTAKALPFHVPFTFTLDGLFYLWQVTLTLVSDDKPLVFHGQGWGRRKLDAEQFAAESVLMKLPEVDKMLVIFGWVNISSFPWKFNGGTCVIWSMSSIHEESCFTVLQLTSQKP